MQHPACIILASLHTLLWADHREAPACPLAESIDNKVDQSGSMKNTVFGGYDDDANSSLWYNCCLATDLIWKAFYLPLTYIITCFVLLLP